MKDKNLENAIKNLQKVIETRKGADQIQDAVRELKEAKENSKELEESNNVSLSMLLSTYCGISNGPLFGIGGFVVGKIVETAMCKSEIVSGIVNDFFQLVHGINEDVK